MKDNMKSLAEKTLKSFLKRKKIGFTAALLTAFMITGEIVTGAAAGRSIEELSGIAAASQASLLDKIQMQKAEIEQLLAENEARLRELQGEELNLLRMADYYSKPIYPSTQIFFNFGYENSGDMKDRTGENFKETISAVQKDIQAGNIPDTVSQQDYDDYIAGRISEYELATRIVRETNGIVGAGEPHSFTIDLGVQIKPMQPDVPTISRSVSVSVDAPDVPSITVNPVQVSAPQFNVTFGGVTPPTIPPVPAISLNVNAPGAVAAVSVPTVTVPTVSVNPQAPIFTPTAVSSPTPPAEPSEPVIVVLTPANLTFNGTGFGQGTAPIVHANNSGSSMALENWSTYQTTAPVTIRAFTGEADVLNGFTVTGGNINVTAPDLGAANNSLTSTWQSTATIVAFISDAADHDVNIAGDYDMYVGPVNRTAYFVSLNPYQTGSGTKATVTDNVYQLDGNLTLHGVDRADTGTPILGTGTAILGFEHQLLARGGGGGQNFQRIITGQVTTELRVGPTGVIDLNSGSNMVGIQIDTEYGNTQTSGFVKRPVTANDGLIKISSGATESIAIDYGHYQTASPNTQVYLGNIVLEGTRSYGLRMKAYAEPAYYNLTTVYGTKSDGTAATVEVKGSQNIGIAMFMGPTDNAANIDARSYALTPGAAGALQPNTYVLTYTDPSDILNHLNITVGGSENVGFYRNFVNNPNAMVLQNTGTQTKVDSITFSAGATKSALIRSDNGEIIVDVNISTGATGVENTMLQAAGSGAVSGTVRNLKTVSTTVPVQEIYGMTAGSFPLAGAGSTNAYIYNEGVIDLQGQSSIGMAVDIGNYGYLISTSAANGIIKVKGQGAVAIYNKGTFELQGSPTVLADGKNAIALFNKGTVNGSTATTLEFTADNGATGIYSDGGTISAPASGLKVTVKNTSAGTDRGIGVYVKGTAGTDNFNNSYIDVQDGSAGVVADGKGLSLQNGTINFNNNGTGAMAYAVFTQNGGTIDLTNSTLNISGNSIGVEIDYAGGTPSVTLTGATVNTTGNAIGFSLKNNPGINVSNIIGDIGTLTGTAFSPTGTTIALLEGGKLFIDQTIEQAETGNSPGNNFYTRLMRQRSVINVGEHTTVAPPPGTPTVTAVPNVIVSATSSAAGQIVGIQTTSSNSATSNADTQINLKNNATVIADRLNAGAGGVGLYSNYGQISIQSGSKVLVETGDGVGLPQVPTGTSNTLNSNGVGVFIVNGAEVTNAGQIKVDGQGGVGIAGMSYRKTSAATNAGAEFNASGVLLPNQGKATITNDTGATIVTSGQSSVGIYAEANASSTGTDPAATASVTNKGLVDANGNNSVGVYLDKASFTNDPAGTVSTGATAGTGTVGLYAKNLTAAETISLGGTFKIGDAGVGILPADAATAGRMTVNGTLKLENAVAGDTSSKIGFDFDSLGSAITLGGTGTPVIDATNLVNGTAVYVKNNSITANVDIKLNGNQRGIYIDGAGNTVTLGVGKSIDIDNGAVGIYSNGNNTINAVTLTAKHNGSVGLYVVGSSTVTDLVAAAQDVSALTDSVVGVYVSGGTLTSVDGDADGFGIALTMGNPTPGADLGTGMYLTDGASVTGAAISLTNNSSTTNAGIYYKKGTGSSPVAHGVDLEFLSGSTVGIYTDDAITVNNAKDIVYNAAFSGNIGAFVAGGSTYNSSSTATTVLGGNSAGIVVGKGLGENLAAGVLTVNNATSAAMAALAPTAGDTGEAKNSGTINVTAGVGMLADSTGLAGTSVVTNNGTINVAGGVGMAVKDVKGVLQGTGIVNAASGTAAIYVENTGAGQTSGFTGTLNLSSGAVGIYANSAVVDTNLNLSAATTGAIGVYALGTAGTPTTITGNIDGSATTSTVSVYLGNEYVAFANNTVSAGITPSGPGMPSAVGVYIPASIPAYTLDNVTVKSDGAGTVGVYAGAAATDYGANALTEVRTNGIGIYVPGGATFGTQGGKIDIYSGIGVVLAAGSTGNIGTSGGLTVEFKGPGATAIYNDGGTLNLGSQFTAIGSGSLVATTNGNLSSGATINAAGSAALLGNYTAGGPYLVENLAAGIINVTAGGVGLGAIGTAGAATVTVRNSGVITASGLSTGTPATPSVGIYTTIADIDNANIINVGADGAGIVADGSNATVRTGTLNLTGAGAIGFVAQGAVGAVTGGTTAGSANETIGAYFAGANVASPDLGTVTLLDDSIGAYITTDTLATPTTVGGTGLKGAFTVGNSTPGKSAVGIYADGGSSVILDGATTVTTGNDAIAIASVDAGTTISNVNPGNLTVGNNGVYLYVENGGDITLQTGLPNLVANDRIGAMINQGGTITNLSGIDVLNGGVGVYFAGGFSPVATINVYAGTAAKSSVGAFYKNIATAITLPTINQTGSYTIGAVLEDTSGTISSPIAIGGAGDTDQIGIVALGKAAPVTVGLGAVAANGDKNIGVYAENASISAGAVTTGGSSASADLSSSSIGIFVSKGTGSGTTSNVTAASVAAGDNTIGVYGEDLDGAGITVSGNITAGESAIGVYGKSAAGTTAPITGNGNLTVGAKKSIGVFGEDTDISFTAAGSAMTVGAGTSVGIVSEGKGNVSWNGSVNVANKGNGTGSIALYKKGDQGTITTGGSWSIGDGGYGIYVDSTPASTINVTNAASFTLGESAVGAFLKGTVTFTNSGNVTVGATDTGADHADVTDDLNSVGFYLADGAKGSSSSGVTMNVGFGHSVGVYAAGTGSEYTNNGTINVTNGGVGLFATENATAINNGTINVDGKDPDPTCTQMSIGMAAYQGATIRNNGAINVTNGALGMLLGTGSHLVNAGTITIDASSTAIKGSVSVTDAGTIIGTGTHIDNPNSATVGDGPVRIEDPGVIVIDGKYVTLGGTLKADKPLVLQNVIVDLTNFDPERPLFTSPDTSGVVQLLSTFPDIGNGYAWKVENFLNALTGAPTSTITVNTSPLFLAKVDETDGSLLIAKESYTSLAIGGQYEEIFEGLDRILYEDPTGGQSASSQVIKGLNSYLETTYQEEGLAEFHRETARTMGEIRGDIYATIQTRMQNVQSAFDGSFDELVNSYNFTKDTAKYSVIYTQGSLHDQTAGIDDYDYRVQGLYYMKEKEGRNFGSKWGWSMGFAVSRFDFDDAPKYFDRSKEDIYSLRAGLHFVKNFADNDSLHWTSRLELGYNRHIAERTLELDRTYKNKGSYNSFQVTFDNKLEKTLIRTLTGKLDLYGAMNLEYGTFGKFTEKAMGDSGLTLDVKGKDYISIQPEAGIKAEKRFYIGKKVSAKIFGSLSAAYELGENYRNNRAQLHEAGDWYDLSVPEKEGWIGKAKAGITFEKANRYGVSFDVEARQHENKKNVDVRFGVRFNYKFMNAR